MFYTHLAFIKTWSSTYRNLKTLGTCNVGDSWTCAWMWQVLNPGRLKGNSPSLYKHSVCQRVWLKETSSSVHRHNTLAAGLQNEPCLQMNRSASPTVNCNTRPSRMSKPCKCSCVTVCGKTSFSICLSEATRKRSGSVAYLVVLILVGDLQLVHGLDHGLHGS